MSAKLTIGFLGAGKMASALARGFLNAKLIKPGQLIASDVYAGARTAFTAATQAKATGSNREVLAFANVLVLAVKPNQVAPDYGVSLPIVYLIWIGVVLVLYLPCRWFAGVKQRRRDVWLSYF